jgi:hypothetical protein
MNTITLDIDIFMKNPQFDKAKAQIEALFKVKMAEAETKEQETEKKNLVAKAKAERTHALKELTAALPKPKYYYDVKVECMLPATLTYRVLAEDAQQAAELIKGKSPNSVQHKLIGRKEMVLRVYDASSTMMRFMKKLLGG